MGATVLMCVQTILLAVVCFMVVKFFRDGANEAERQNEVKRAALLKKLEEWKSVPEQRYMPKASDYMYGPIDDGSEGL